MKIEWLTDECDEARLTRGWWRKQFATVKWGTDRNGNTYAWRYQPSGNHVSNAVDRKLNAARIEHRRTRDWQPVRKLPAARTVTP